MDNHLLDTYINGIDTGQMFQAGVGYFNQVAPVPAITINIQRIGAGQTHTTWGAFCTWINSRDLVANNEIVHAFVHENITGGATAYSEVRPATFDNTHYCLIRPAVGMGVNELETGVFNYGTQGIEITALQGAGFKLGKGVILEGFRIVVPSVSYGGGAAIILHSMGVSGAEYTSQLRRNRIHAQNSVGRVISTGGEAITDSVTDNLILLNGTSTDFVVGNDWGTSILRNTFVRLSGTADAVVNPFLSTCLLKDNLFIGFNYDPITRTTDYAAGNCSNNFSDTTFTGNTTGFTFVTDGLVRSSTNDFRPIPTEELIGAASTSAAGTTDIMGHVRGATSDVGAYQVTGVPERMYGLLRMTETGDGISPYLYQGTGTDFGGGEADSYNPDAFAAGRDGVFSIKLAPGWQGGGSGNLMVGVDDSPTNQVYSDLLYAVQVRNLGNTYRYFTSGSATEGLNYAVANDGDIVRMRREATTLYGEVSKDNGETYILIATWTGVPTTQLYAHVQASFDAKFTGVASYESIPGDPEPEPEPGTSGAAVDTFSDVALNALVAETPWNTGGVTWGAATYLKGDGAGNLIRSTTGGYVLANALLNDDNVGLAVFFTYKPGFAIPVPAIGATTSSMYTSQSITASLEYGNLYVRNVNSSGGTIAVQAFSGVTLVVDQDYCLEICRAVDASGLRYVGRVSLASGGVRGTLVKSGDLTIPVAVAADAHWSQLHVGSPAADISGFRRIESLTTSFDVTAPEDPEDPEEPEVPDPIVLAPGINIITIGAGKQFATLNLFGAWLALQDLIAASARIKAHVYNDDTPNVRFEPATANSSFYCEVMPAPGYGVTDLGAPNVLEYGTLGVELTANIESSFVIGMGVAFEGFRVRVPKESVGYHSSWSAVRMGRHAVAGDHLCAFRRNRVISYCGDPGNATVSAVVGHGHNSTKSQVTDNLFVMMGGRGRAVEQSWSGLTDRNVVVRLGPSVGFSAIRHAGYGGASLQNNVFINCGGTPVILDQEPAVKAGNFTNVALTGSSAGFTVVTEPNGLVVDDATDFRPKAGGPLINGATAAANTTLDIMGSNRGTTPDAGAWQLVPAIPLPSGTIISTIVDGQNVTVTCATENSPTSGTASLPVATTPNGAVAQGPTSVTLGAGTATVQWIGVPPGNYAAPVITFVNAGGASGTSPGGLSVAILGITGSPEGISPLVELPPELPPAPEATIDSVVLVGPRITVSGTVNLQGDILGTLRLFFDPHSGGSIIGPINVVPVGSNWTYETGATEGVWSVRVLASSNGQSTEASSSNFTVLGITGIVRLPVR